MYVYNIVKSLIAVRCFGIFAIFHSAAICSGHLSFSPFMNYGQRSGVYTAERDGGVTWPKPQQTTPSSTVFSIDPKAFKVTSQGAKCDIVTNAIKRYQTSLFFPPLCFGETETNTTTDSSFSSSSGQISTLQIVLSGKCEETPHPEMNESYELKVGGTDLPDGTATIYSVNEWGALRALETFSQLLYRNAAQQDLMAMNKFNVLHWHIVDDDSFPYASKMFPEMAEKGSFNPISHIYSIQNITSVIEYARQRGIRVLPEFDTPGHTQSWGKGAPDLLTKCYSNNAPDGTFGPIDPTVNSTYVFLEQFFAEVTEVFGDSYIHLGGDEVNFTCWQSNPNIASFMKNMSITGDYVKLESYYINNLLDIFRNLKRSYIVWQEVFDNGCKIAKDTVVHVWKTGYKNEMSAVTKKGFNAILSSCWYLNYIKYGDDWKPFYECDPYDFEGTPAQKELVMGGEACMWGEWVDASNVITRTWPRASFVGERLWSDQSVRDETDASNRLNNFRCLMIRRGYAVQPFSGPGFCQCDASM